MSAGTALATGSILGSAGNNLVFTRNNSDDLAITVGTSQGNRKSYFEAEINTGSFTAGFGNLAESDSWLNNTSSGSFGTFDGTNTNLVYFGRAGGFGAIEYRIRYAAGSSQIQHTDTLFAQLPGSSRSRAWQLQTKTRFGDNSALGVGLQQPLTITHAQIGLRTIATADEEGNLSYKRVTASLAAAHREVDAYGYVSTTLDKGTTLYIFANVSRNFLNQQGARGGMVGVSVEKNFH
jgi:hypothetical protein